MARYIVTQANTDPWWFEGDDDHAAIRYALSEGYKVRSVMRMEVNEFVDDWKPYQFDFFWNAEDGLPFEEEEYEPFEDY